MDFDDDNYRSPTYALIDIDPGTKTTWDEVLTLARLYRAALEHLKVLAWPKVTGKRGIQVWVPVKQIYTYRQTSAWVEAVSRAVGAAVPDLGHGSGPSRREAVRRASTSPRTRSTRRSSRRTPCDPSPTPAVSAPIGWDELDDPDLRPDRWNIKTILDRVVERGDLFAPVLEIEQELPSVD